MEIVGPVEKFEKIIYAVLMIMLMVVVIAAIIDLGATGDSALSAMKLREQGKRWL